MGGQIMFRRVGERDDRVVRGGSRNIDDDFVI